MTGCKFVFFFIFRNANEWRRFLLRRRWRSRCWRRFVISRRFRPNRKCRSAASSTRRPDISTPISGLESQRKPPLIGHGNANMERLAATLSRTFNSAATATATPPTVPFLFTPLAAAATATSASWKRQLSRRQNKLECFAASKFVQSRQKWVGWKCCGSLFRTAAVATAASTASTWYESVPSGSCRPFWSFPSAGRKRTILFELGLQQFILSLFKRKFWRRILRLMLACHCFVLFVF